MWRIPGTWTIVNLDLTDFSLRLRNLGLGMSFEHRSPKTLSRCLRFVNMFLCVGIRLIIQDTFWRHSFWKPTDNIDILPFWESCTWFFLRCGNQIFFYRIHLGDILFRINRQQRYSFLLRVEHMFLGVGIRLVLQDTFGRHLFWKPTLTDNQKWIVFGVNHYGKKMFALTITLAVKKTHLNWSSNIDMRVP